MSTNPHQKKKIALIFVWSQFQDLENRVVAGMNDIQNMLQVWKSLGFETEKFHNCKKSVFEEKIEKVKQEYDTNTYSCLAIVVSTHGEECESIFRTEPTLFTPERKIIQHKLFVKNDNDDQNWDDFFVLDDDLIQKFDNSEVDTPKIFLIQSCRQRSQGRNERNPNGAEECRKVDDYDGFDIGIKIKLVDKSEDECYPELQGTNENNRIAQPSDRQQDITPYCPPCVQNSIVVFSAPSGYISSGGYQGSTLLTEIYEQLKVTMEEFSFVKFIRLVNHNLSKKDKTVEDNAGGEFNCKPVVSVSHRLTADIRLKKQS